MVFIMKTQVLWPAYVAINMGRDWIGGFGKGTRADFSSLTHCACDTHLGQCELDAMHGCILHCISHVGILCIHVGMLCVHVMLACMLVC